APHDSGFHSVNLFSKRLDDVTHVVELGTREVHACLERARVDFEKKVTLLHQLIVPDRHTHELTGYARDDLNHLGPHQAIACPGILDVIHVFVGNYAKGCEHDRARGDDSHDRFHAAHPGSRKMENKPV